MAPYEALYGRKYRSPIHWDEVGQREKMGPEIVKHTTDLVARIRDRMKTAQSRQKSYADNKRRDLKFAVGDHVFVKIAPIKGVMRFGVHNVFHISMLRKYMSNPSHVLNFEPLQLTPNLSYEERSARILGRQERRLRNKVIKMIKVKWQIHSEEEATWETETDMRSRYWELFGDL
ncbi:uncharacterized protein LOC122013804 [Zingiber officinale]|uniref:uncharacterized protein LOC122013804 n=1 Tax=Zingiber officinale TaxID=94328 RepID=UPI001C4B2EF8|nr:uncharacterized protein LOC122013804 [Zingiber officinale]